MKLDTLDNLIGYKPQRPGASLTDFTKPSTSPSGVGTPVVNNVNFLQEGYRKTAGMEPPAREASIDDLIGFKPRYPGQSLSDYMAGNDNLVMPTVQGTDYQGRLRTFQNEQAMIDNLAQGRASYEQASQQRSDGITFRREQPGGLDLSTTISDRERRGETLSMANAVDMAGGNRSKARAMIVQGRQPRSQADLLDEEALRMKLAAHRSAIDTEADLLPLKREEQELENELLRMKLQPEADPELRFVDAPNGGKSFAVYGNTVLDATPDSPTPPKRTSLQVKLDALDQQREEAGLPALSPDERLQYMQQDIDGAGKRYGLSDFILMGYTVPEAQAKMREQAAGRGTGTAPQAPAADPATTKKSIFEKLGL